jgi:hypothetical protein
MCHTILLPLLVSYIKPKVTRGLLLFETRPYVISLSHVGWKVASLTFYSCGVKVDSMLL